MKKFKYGILFWLAMISNQAIANGVFTFTAQLEKMTFYEDAGIIIIYPKGGINVPDGIVKNTCATSDYISFSSNRAMAKEYLSGLLSAYATKAPVQLTLYNDCVDHSVSHTLLYFSLEDF